MRELLCTTARLLGSHYNVSVLLRILESWTSTRVLQRATYTACLPRTSIRCTVYAELDQRLHQLNRDRFTMRFKAKIVDISSIEQFTRVVGTIAKLTQLCVLRATEDYMYFILNDKVSKGSLWCELQTNNLFSDYAMEGYGEDANEIFLEITPDDVVRAMKTGQNAKTIKLKLTKKFSPCLSIEVELPSRTGHSRNITHDIPVTVIPPRLWSEYKEPTVPEFDVTICMPPLKALRNVTERMKNLGSYLELSANQSGEMRLRVESDLVTVSTHFRDLENPEWEGANSQASQQDPTLLIGAKVDIRKFIHFLSGQQLNPTKIICSIVDNQVMHFFLLHEDLSIQYSMPIIQV